MAQRKRCLEKGHKFKNYALDGSAPYEFCSRMKCSATRVSPWVTGELGALLNSVIPEEDRVRK